MECPRVSEVEDYEKACILLEFARARNANSIIEIQSRFIAFLCGARKMDIKLERVTGSTCSAQRLIPFSQIVIDECVDEG